MRSGPVLRSGARRRCTGSTVGRVRWLPRTLRDRLTVLFAAGAALLVGLSAVLLYAVLTAQLGSAVDEGLATRAAELAADVRSNDSSTLQVDDRYAQVFTPDGRVLSSPATPPEPLLTARELELTSVGVLTIDRRLPGLGDLARLRAEAVGTPVGQFVVVVGEDLGVVEGARVRVLTVVLVGGVLLVALSAVGVRLLVGAALRPVGALTREAATITEADPHRRLPQPAGADELAELARTLNGMLARLEVAIERERGFVDDASHELRTPLTVLRGELELGLASGDPATMRTAMVSALRETERLSALAADLLVLARDRAAGAGGLPLRREPLDLRAVAEAGRRLATTLGAAYEVTGPAVVVPADRVRLEQVIANLISNAAAAGAAQVQVRVGVEGSSAVLDVLDDGPGFPTELLPSAFERFTRGERARTRRDPEGAEVAGGAGGAGLGLAIVAALVRAHGGRVSAGNDSPLGGARVRVELPHQS